MTHCVGLLLFKLCLLKVSLMLTWQYVFVCVCMCECAISALPRRPSRGFFEPRQSSASNIASLFHQIWLWVFWGFPPWSQLHSWTAVLFPGLWHSQPLCCSSGCRASSGLWCKERGELFGCLGRSWDRRGQSVMEWLLSSLLSCLPWHECPSSSTLKGTLLAQAEWDILATDPRAGVKGNRGADEREHNYGQKTKRNLVCKQLFWWEGGEVGFEGGHNWDQDIFPGKLCPYRVRCPVMCSWGPTLIGRAVALI